MAQGWTIDATADTITFLEAPPAGVGNVVVVQNPTGGNGGTDVWAMGAWSAHFGYPGEVEFYSDRLWFAGSPSDPAALWASCTGDYNNFGRSSPIVDSDSLSYRINARQINRIMDLLPLDNLIAMTTAAEWKVTGGADQVVSPSTIGARNQGYYGSGLVPAKIIGESAVFHQLEGQVFRDLRWTFEKDGFRGNDISVWASHLFQGFTFTGIEHWKAPWSVLWYSREDGIQVGCTYLPEQEVIGHHWHDTDGKWLDACALPNQPDTDCFFLSQRTIDGELVQYIEQQASTRWDDEDDMFFVDAGVTYDGRNGTATTLTLTSNTGGWGEADEIEVTASAPIFAGESDIGDAFLIHYTAIEQQQVDGELKDVEVAKKLQVKIDTDDSSTVVQGHVVGQVPESLQGVPTTAWTFQRDTIEDLWHLEGKNVVVLQDGGVSGPFLVEDGRIELGEPGGVVHVGLAYTAEVETLELNSPGGEPARDMNKLVYQAAILVRQSRGILAQDILRRGTTIPMKDRTDENFGEAPRLRDGIIEVNIPSTWGVDAGRVRLLSPDPLPMELLAITISAAGSVKR